MLSAINGSLRRTGLILVLALSIVLGGTALLVKTSTDHLLYSDATLTAQNWARLLGESVTDLEQIARGEMASVSSVVFLQWAQKVGRVYRYEIYNLEGYSQMVSDRGVAFANISKFNPEALRSLQLRKAIVSVREGDNANHPPFYADAFFPVVVDGNPIAIVAAYVDQTERRDEFYRAFLVAAAALSLLAGVGFGLPAVAFYRRTKEKQAADRHIHYLARHDAMTGLMNRTTIVRKMNEMLVEQRDTNICMAVHFLDLDRFKSVNDTFGHDAGDHLLKTTAERLLEAVRATDFVARIGGDEFVIVQTNVRNGKNIDELASRILSALRAPIDFNGHLLNSTSSIGIAIAPADGDSAEQLLKRADLALYVSKAEGRDSLRFFNADMEAALATRLSLERSIHNAVDHHKFELYFQPVLEMNGRELIGFEALIRMQGANGELIPPLEFIPVAESMKLIEKIGEWVLREACRNAVAWPEHLTVAVNLSPAQFDSCSISKIVADALEESGLTPNRLELEITETLLLGDNQAVMAELLALKAMGVAVVMDDFGTGYSSLSYLWRFPFDKIKIDRSFMMGFDQAGRDVETVVKTIIALGRELNMRVTVEGVETARQAEFLDLAEADQVQGYYFGRPMPATEVASSILDNYRRKLLVAPPAKKTGTMSE